MNAFIQQGYIKLIQKDSKDIYDVTKKFYSSDNQHNRMISEGSCDTVD